MSDKIRKTVQEFITEFNITNMTIGDHNWNMLQDRFDPHTLMVMRVEKFWYNIFLNVLKELNIVVSSN